MEKTMERFAKQFNDSDIVTGGDIDGDVKVF